VPAEDMQDVLGLLVAEDEQAEPLLLPAGLTQRQQELPVVPAAGETGCEVQQQQHTRTSLELARMLQQQQPEQYGLQQQQQQPEQYGLQQQQQQQLQPEQCGLQQQNVQQVQLQESQQLQLQQQVPQQQSIQQCVPDGFVFGQQLQQQLQQQQQVPVLPYNSMQGAAAGIGDAAVYHTPQQHYAATVATGMPAVAAAGFVSPFVVELPTGAPAGAPAAAVAAAAGLPANIGAGALNPAAVFNNHANNVQQQQQQRRPPSRGNEGASSAVQDSGSSGSGAAAAGAAAAADGGKPRRRRKPSDAQREAHRRFRQRRKDLVRGPGGRQQQCPVVAAVAVTLQTVQGVPPLLIAAGLGGLLLLGMSAAAAACTRTKPSTLRCRTPASFRIQTADNHPCLADLLLVCALCAAAAAAAVVVLQCLLRLNWPPSTITPVYVYLASSLLLLLLQMSTLEAEVAAKQAQLTALSAENVALNAKARALDQLLASAGKRREVPGANCVLFFRGRAAMQRRLLHSARWWHAQQVELDLGARGGCGAGWCWRKSSRCPCSSWCTKGTALDQLLASAGATLSRLSNTGGCDCWPYSIALVKIYARRRVAPAAHGAYRILCCSWMMTCGFSWGASCCCAPGTAAGIRHV
jgi:hypothetical protein